MDRSKLQAALEAALEEYRVDESDEVADRVVEIMNDEGSLEGDRGEIWSGLQNLLEDELDAEVSPSDVADLVCDILEEDGAFTDAEDEEL